MSSPDSRMRRQTCQPVEVGQLEVEHEGVGGGRGHGLESFAPGGHGADLVAFQAQRPVD